MLPDDKGRNARGQEAQIKLLEEQKEKESQYNQDTSNRQHVQGVMGHQQHLTSGLSAVVQREH